MSPLSNTINAIDRQKNHIFTNYLSFRGSELLNLSDHIGAILSKQCRISPYLVTDAFSQKTPLVFNSKYPNFFCNSNFEENIQFRLKNYHDCSSCSALTCGNHIGDYIDQIICLFEYANENRLYADPHLKNFTLKDNILNYVDISPPYSEIYNEFVIEKATNDIDKFLIEKNLMFFRWDWLPFHFSADLISIDLDAITWMDDLYQMLKKSFSTNIDKDNFKQRVIMVRFYEDKRIAKGLNLL